MVKWRDTRFFGLDKTLTEEQETYLDAIENPEIQLVIVNAKAGTGKTTLAVGASKLAQKGLTYIFNPTEEDKLGFTPGDTEEKESKYLAPLKDALCKIGELPEKSLENKMQPSESAWVKAMSHVFLRGSNLEDTFIIIDEAQNFTTHDLKKVLTRIHDNCKVIVIGHTGQCDLADPTKSGFEGLIHHFKDRRYCKVINLTKNFRGRLAQDADEL